MKELLEKLTKRIGLELPGLSIRVVPRDPGDGCSVEFRCPKGDAHEYTAAWFSDSDRGDAATEEVVMRELVASLSMLYAVVSTDIPDGAVMMEMGATRTFGTHRRDAPVEWISRQDRTFRRVGDVEPRPFPPIVFRHIGRRGIVEHAP